MWEEVRRRRERRAWRRVDLVEEAAEAPRAEDVRLTLKGGDGVAKRTCENAK